MLTTSLHKCLNCGYVVEMFSDEQSVRCRSCEARVYRDASPTCAQWCSSARACLGEKRWRSLLEGDSGDRQSSKADCGDAEPNKS